MSYYNTTNLNGADLKKSRGRAESQTEKILRFFLANPDRAFTPAEIDRAMDGYFLLTSIRRSMSDLTKSGDLIKTEEQGIGHFRAPNYKWTLNQTKHPKQLKLF